MTEKRARIFRFLSDFNRLKWSIAVKAILSGAVAGLLAVLYRLIIEYGTSVAVRLYAFFRENPAFLLPWILGCVAAGLFLAWLVKLEPTAKGSGIPHVEGVVLFGLKMKWNTILAVRFLAGLVSSFFGLSLGREGPSIQIGAAGGQAVSKMLGNNRVEENYLITGGAAAGLAAAFNAPLSGVIFALEEVHRNFSPAIMLTATAASLIADFVSKYFLGLTPELHFTTIPQMPIPLYIWMLPVGIASGLVGSLINKALLKADTLYKKMPARWAPTLALLIAVPCGLFFPLTLGSGRDLVEFAEMAQGGITVLVSLLVVKLLFTCTSFGSGIPGGIFMPILSVGTLTGSIVGIFAVQIGLLPSQYIPDLAVCAMAGAMAASVKAPITAILLTAEMTGSLIHLLPVAACAFIALLVSDFLKVEPIYEVLLERSMEQEKTVSAGPQEKCLMEIPVELGSRAAGKRVDEILWPAGSLIVSLRRGSREIIPHGDTKLMAGDYIVVFFSDGEEYQLRQDITALCHEKF